MAKEELHMGNNLFNNVAAEYVRPGTRALRIIDVKVLRGNVLAEETSVEQHVIPQWLEGSEKAVIKFVFSGLNGYSYEVKRQDNPDVFDQIAEACRLS